MLHVRRDLKEFIGQGDTIRDNQENRLLLSLALTII